MSQKLFDGLAPWISGVVGAIFAYLGNNMYSFILSMSGVIYLPGNPVKDLGFLWAALAVVLIVGFFIIGMLIGLFIWILSAAKLQKYPRRQIEAKMQVFMRQNPKENIPIVRKYYAWCFDKVYGANET